MRIVVLGIFILLGVNLMAATINAGTYSVKSGGNYTNLASAISALNTNGITGNGNVIFEIGDNQTISAQTINDISGADVSNQIIFRAESGTNPVITFNLSSAGLAGILFNGTDYVTFDGWDQQGGTNRDITFKLSGNNGKVFEFKDGINSEYITIKNLIIIGNSNTISGYYANIYYKESTTDDNFQISHITIKNNYIYKNAYGIKLNAKITDDNNYLDITDNKVGYDNITSSNHLTMGGIYVTEFKYVNINSNEILNVNYRVGISEVNGIWLEAIDSLICDTNNIHDIVANRRAYAIKVRSFGYSGTKGYRIGKNIITDINTESSGAAGTDAAGICYSIMVSEGLITENEISEIYCKNISGNPAGMGTWAVGSLKNMTISRNDISRIYNAATADDSNTIYSGRGLYFNGTLVEKILIVNNFIYAIGGGSNRSSSAYGSGDFNETYPFGIFINTSSAAGTSPQIKIYHNSVYMTENAKSNASQTAYALNSATSSFAGAIGINTTRTNFIDMRNNIFYNTISPAHTNQFKPQYAVLVYNTSNPFSSSDYNIYKMERQLHQIWCKQYNYVAAVNGGTTAYAKPLSDNTCNGGAGSTTYGSGCADWQDFTGDDANSVNHNITFTCSGGLSPTILTDDTIFRGIGDLHVDLTDVIGGEDVGVTEDFDGDSRTAPYSIGADQGGGALPITLADFSAKPNFQNTVNLKWITSSEINNDFYTIERSIDTENWEKIETIKGAGNSNNIIFYNTQDREPYSGISYYRLKQTDYNGKYTYSKIKAIKILDELNADVSVYPNPTEGNITIESTSRELSQIKVHNLIGEDLSSKIKTSRISDTKAKIDLTNLPKGVYLLKTLTKTLKIIIIQQ